MQCINCVWKQTSQLVLVCTPRCSQCLCLWRSQECCSSAQQYVSVLNMTWVVQAVSAEHPDHPVSGPRAERTVLQQHVDFWDFDRDGKCVSV